jgi:Cu(I)/Ag(I) efflux system membrane protein CusA/SilA
MLNWIILWSLQNRLVMLILAFLLFVFGVRAALQVPLDVFPEFAPPQVVIQTEAVGLSAEEVEQLVTLPLETQLNGTAELDTIRSSSIVGLSVITCVFQPNTDIFRARQLITEKLQLASTHLPITAGQPQMMPISAPAGILLKISLTSDKTSLMDLRTIADWTIRPRLLAVPGVAQVTTFGGEVKQYQVIPDAVRLKDYGVTLEQVVTASRSANENAGAGFYDTSQQSMVIQGEGRVHSLADLENAIIEVKNNVPVRIRDVAKVQLGAEYKVGDSSTFGRPSVFLMVTKQPWANTLTTTSAAEVALDQVNRALPADVVLDPTIFRQADFIERAISNINSAMIQGGILVIIVLLLFLFSWRAGVISFTAIPLSLLVAIIVLERFGGTINTMTLGGLAIAIGEVVDDAIIDVENVFRRLRENRAREKPDPVLSVIYHASTEVRGSVVYATIIVALVFLPVFSLSGLAGRIFAPLGYAYIIAILASLFVALTVTPALCYFLLPRVAMRSEETRTTRLLKRHYRRFLDPVLNHPGTVLAVSVLLLVGVLVAVPFLGGEFLPDFNEGNLIIHMNGLPGTSLEESMRVGAIVQDRLRLVPETLKTAQRSGRTELGEDTFGPNITELDVNLKDSSRVRDEVLDDVRRHLDGIVGFTFNVMQFISERIEETLTGTTATVVVKVFGPDLDVLQAKGTEVRNVMAGIEGVTDLAIEQQTGVPKLLIQFHRYTMALHGLNSRDVAEAIETAFFGTKVSEVFEQQRSFDLVVRFDRSTASNLDSIRSTLIDTPLGGKIPLAQLADIEIVNAPGTINRENAQRRVVVSSNIDGSLSSVVPEIKRRVAEKVQLPAGYYIAYGGQYEARTEAFRQILLLGAAAVVGIFLLLFLAFRSLRQSVLVMSNLPLALIGGVAAVLIASEGKTSVASLVGFVTLFGIATRNGIMLMTHYNHLMIEENMPFGRELVIRGAMERLAPILMTALTAGLGLLPLALSAGRPGRELEQPMAVVIIGGLLTSTFLNMIVLPTLFLKFGREVEPEQRTILRQKIAREHLSIPGEEPL